MENIAESKRVNAIVVALMLCSLFIKWIEAGSALLAPDLSQYTWTDFLINYSGGFVRRGLMGELLYMMSAAAGVRPEVAIGIISVGAYLATFGLMLHLFRRRGENVLILLSPLMCGYTVDIIRKDYLLCLLLMLSVYILSDIKHSNRLYNRQLNRLSNRQFNRDWSVAVGVTLIALMLHEAYIFWGVPAVMLLIYSRVRIEGRGMWSLWSAGVIFAAAFVVLSWFKGDAGVRDAVYASWNRLYGEGYLDGAVGNSIGAIGWDAKEIFHNHFEANFYREGLGCLPAIWRVVYFLLAYRLYYYFAGGKVITGDRRQETGDRGLVDSRQKTVDEYCGVWVLVSVCLLPMFTVLSCDYGRLYFYLFMACYIVRVIVPEGQLRLLLPERFIAMIGALNVMLFSGRLRPRVWIALTMLLVLAPAPHGFALLGAANNSVIGSIVIFLAAILGFSV